MQSRIIIESLGTSNCPTTQPGKGAEWESELCCLNGAAVRVQVLKTLKYRPQQQQLTTLVVSTRSSWHAWGFPTFILCALWRVSTASIHFQTFILCAVWRVSTASIHFQTFILCAVWRVSTTSIHFQTFILCAVWRVSTTSIHFQTFSVLCDVCLQPRSTFRLSPTIRSIATGNKWSGPMKPRILRFDWSARLVSCKWIGV